MLNHHIMHLTNKIHFPLSISFSICFISDPHWCFIEFCFFESTLEHDGCIRGSNLRLIISPKICCSFDNLSAERRAENVRKSNKSLGFTHRLHILAQQTRHESFRKQTWGCCENRSYNPADSLSGNHRIFDQEPSTRIRAKDCCHRS